MVAASVTADRWRRLIRQHQASGLSVTAFCLRAGVSQPSFYAWRRRLRDEVTFAEVKVSRETISDADGIELRLPGRRCVVVRPGFDRGTLLELLAALEASSSDPATREAIP
jgi:transposase-like protein